MSPFWTLLLLGDYKSWNMLIDKYYKINQAEDPLLNPFLILIYVISLRSCPLVVKQALVDFESA